METNHFEYYIIKQGKMWTTFLQYDYNSHFNKLSTLLMNCSRYSLQSYIKEKHNVISQHINTENHISKFLQPILKFLKMATLHTLG